MRSRTATFALDGVAVRAHVHLVALRDAEALGVGERELERLAGHEEAQGG